MPALPPKRSIPPRPKPPSGTTTPVSLIATPDPSKPCDPFQPFGADVIDHFQAKKGLGDPFSGKDPFIPSSASSNAPKESTSSFTDVSSDLIKSSLGMKLSNLNGPSERVSGQSEID
ncbi:PREDICTED: epidermal growth factor receptor substrate 15-like 1 isoform X3 [Poecilia mexicana]|nr:PREDICTED: epidermal growth factor receptor substrate 15-like 1 isoform X3 [Poecilia mexicana]